MKKNVFTVLILIVIAAALLTVTGRPTQAQGSGAADPALIAKLDEILNNQKLIMAELSSLKDELNIVKIRVTQVQ